MSKRRPQIAVVLGMHRSGTSALTRGLSALGAELGGKLLPPGLDNEKGYWEDADINALNEELLKTLGTAWHGMEAIEDGVLDALAQGAWGDRAAGLLRGKLAEGRVFAMKDPRTARLLAFWQRVFQRLDATAVYVLACRHPLCVAQSLAARNGFGPAKSALLWLLHLLPMLRLTEGQDRRVVDYDRLMDFPLRELKRVAPLLGLPFDESAPALVDYARAFLEERLRHHRASDIGPEQQSGLPPFVLEIHEGLLRLAADETPTGLAAALDKARAWLEQEQARRPSAEPDGAGIGALTAAANRLATGLRMAEGHAADLAQRNAALERAVAARDDELLALGLRLEAERLEAAALTSETRRLAAMEESWRAAREDGARNQEKRQTLEEALRRQAVEIDTGRARLLELQDRQAALEGDNKRLAAMVEDREAVIADMRLSTSWRLTKPLRLAGQALGRGKRKSRSAAKPPAARSPAPVRNGGGGLTAKNLGETLKGQAATLAFNTSDAPDVSIIIPLYKRLDDTLACLASIAANSGTDYSYEIIAQDDGVDEPIAHRLPKAEGLFVSLNEKNLGFVWNCKTSARKARGRYLLFLNSDTLVGPGWLAPLVRLADADPCVGIVGAKLLNPDGTIQDAGWAVLDNGWGVPIGRGGDAGCERYNYVREVDCVIGACLLTPRALYEQVGGFDPAYAPAYYEEFDYAFTLRRLGYKVFYQPESQVVHLDCASYGEETRNRLSAANHATFVGKWGEALKGQPASGVDEFIACERNRDRPVILCIDDKLPEYDRHAGGMAVDMHLALMSRMGWRVVYAPFDGLAPEPYAQRLRQKGIELVTAAVGLEDWLERNGRHLSLVWVARPNVAQPLLALLRAKTAARLLYFTHDLHYLREQRRYEIERDPAILVEAARLRSQELAIFAEADRILAPSEEEAGIIRALVPGADAVYVPLYFFPGERPEIKTPADFAPLKDVVFVGGFPHRPNVDAALWLAREIMPLVWKEEPKARLLLIGTAPPPEVTALAGERIIVTGQVPDLAPYFAKARLSVSPLRYGAGVKGKIVSAMQAGVPVVTTPIGAEGIGLVNDASALIAADGPGLAAAILRLLRDPLACHRLALAGAALIEERYSETAALRILQKALSFDDGRTPPRDLSDYFCGQPWTTLEIYDGGAYPCCPAWNDNKALGNIHLDAPGDIWNGQQAQRYRQGVLDGSFSQCDRDKCYLIAGRRLARRDDIERAHLGPFLKDAMDRKLLVMAGGPKVVKLGYDASCNLACPSCRTKVMAADKDEQRRLDAIFNDRVLPLLADAEVLLISSDGDAFASRHYRQVLQTTAQRFANLKLGITTNGQLLDEKAWNDCRLEGRVLQIQLSVDAATPATYAKLRAPGRFDRLLANLEFLAKLRRQNRFGKLELLFVVQADNFAEMPDFVRLGKTHGADAVSFLPIDQWARGMDDLAYRRAKVWDEAHPSYRRFCDILADPLLSDPIVQLNGLQTLRDGNRLSEIAVTQEGAIERRRRTTAPPLDPRKRTVADFFSVFRHSLTPPDNLDRPDIVLVQAPGWGVNTPPLATATLAAYLRGRSFKVLPLDLNLEFFMARPPSCAHAWDMEQSLWFWNTKECVNALLAELDGLVQAFVDTVAASGCKAVGFTIYESSAHVSLELAKRLKARLPHLFVVLGGPHASKDIAGMSLIRHEAVDAVAQGEGEELLADLLERLADGRPLQDCPGLLLKTEQGDNIHDTGPRPQIARLDSLPDADFSDYAFQAYLAPTRLPIMGSRGCPNRCIYCSERTFWKSFRFRSAQSIFAEIKRQLKLYPFLNFVDFQDSLVNGKISELERLADLIIQSGMDIHWTGQAVIRKEMTPELLAKLKRSGCVCLAYGLETPSPKLMRHIGKLLSRGADIDAIAQAHGSVGLDAVYNVMFGLPGETEDDAFAVLEFLRRNKKHRLVVNPSPSFCGFSRGTDGFERAQDFGIDFTLGNQFWQSADGANTYLTRLKRFEDFCRLVAELGIQTTYPATRLLDRNRALGRYHEARGAPEIAKGYYRDWLLEHPEDLEIRAVLQHLLTRLKESGEIPVPYSLPASNDENWRNGVARGWGSAFLLDANDEALSDMRPGRSVVLPGGEKRRIVKIRENQGSLIVHYDGAPLDADHLDASPVVRLLRPFDVDAAPGGDAS